MRSPALSADGRHLMTDVMTSAVVIVGLLLVPVTGWVWLDSRPGGLRCAKHHLVGLDADEGEHRRPHG